MKPQSILAAVFLSVISGCDHRNPGTDSATSSCGNGILEPGEACDDGNNLAGDGCTADCLSDEVCGNGIVDPGEQCDWSPILCPGVEPQTCNTSCQCVPLLRCGNGTLQAGEQCDPPGSTCQRIV